MERFPQINEIIPIITIGASILFTIYHIILYLNTKNIILLNYCLYLAFFLLFLIFPEVVVENDFLEISKFKLIIGTFSFWLCNYFYHLFIYSSLDFSNNKKPQYLKILKCFWIVFPKNIILQIICIYFNFGWSNPIGKLFIFIISIDLAIFYFAFFFIYPKFNLNKYLTIGGTFTLLSYLFTLIALYHDGYFYLFSALTYISIGIFIQIIYFSLAVSEKIKAEEEMKLLALKNISQQELELDMRKKQELDIRKKQELVLENERYNAVVEQRGSIGKKLHDDLSGSLLTLKYMVNSFKNEINNIEDKYKIIELENEINYIYNETRNYSHILSNTNQKLIEEKSGGLSIKDYLYKVQKQFHDFNLLKLHLKIDEFGLKDKINNIQTEAIYYCLKECLSNILKHANAKNICISIAFTNKKGTIIIKDDGKNNEKKLNSGQGLNNLEANVNILKGELHFNFSEKYSSIQIIFELK